MSRVLQAVDDLDSAEHRTTAYTYIGVPTEQIIEHVPEATNSERLRRSIYNLKQHEAWHERIRLLHNLRHGAPSPTTCTPYFLQPDQRQMAIAQFEEFQPLDGRPDQRNTSRPPQRELRRRKLEEYTMTAAKQEIVEHVEQAPVVQGESAALISVIERAARDPNVDVDKFERLMAMKERVEAANAKGFQLRDCGRKGEIPVIHKNATGHNSKKYADFSRMQSR